MRSRIAALALLLAAQLALAGYLGLARTGSAPAPVTLALPAAEAVEAITIAPPMGTPDADEPAADDAEAPGVSLRRREGGWTLAGADDLPADAARVENLLATLAGLRPGAPVADSAAARRRFAVAKDRYERRITLRTAEGERVLYLGTAAGTRRAHLRAAGNDAIHLAALALYEVPADADGWLDKTLLQLPEAHIAAIEVADLRLTRTASPAANAAAEPAADGATDPTDQAELLAADDAAAPAGGSPPDAPDTPPAPADAAGPAAADPRPAAEADRWLGSGPAGPLPVSDTAVDELARRLAGLRVAGIADQAPAGEPVLRLRVERSEGSARDYRLFAPGPAPASDASSAEPSAAAADADYLLTASDWPQTFRVPAFLAEPLRAAADRQALLAADEASGAGAADAAISP